MIPAAELWVHPVRVQSSKGEPTIPSAPWETRDSVGGSALGGSLVFVRNNDINHNIKQKPPRGRISKLAQHRAQPTGELPASGHSQQIPGLVLGTRIQPKPWMEEWKRRRAGSGLLWDSAQKCESEHSVVVRCLLGIHPNGTAPLPLALQVNLACGLHNLLT